MVAAGGHCSVGHGVMTSSTYPNHATFATGSDPVVHGILGNWIVTENGPRPAHAVGPRCPTIFDACRRAGRATAAIVGDHHLVGVMGAHVVDIHWPPEGKLPPDTPRDDHGYAADHAVVPHLLAALDGGFDLVIGHLNAPDTAGHVYGPDSAEAAEAYRASDAALGQVIEGLKRDWSETVVIVVSDHGQETVSDQEPIDLYAAAETADRSMVIIPEGGSAVIWGDDPTAGRWLSGVDGVEGHAEVGRAARVVWAASGRTFALPAGIQMDAHRGQHGGMGTLDQVAVVGGGHPAVATVANGLRARVVQGADWAPTICALLGIELPSAMGRSVLA
jgi:arylsulfatase A-like enzyme